METELHQSAFTSSDPHVAKVGKGGVVLPMADGVAVIAAKTGGQTARVKVTVTGFKTAGGWSFRNDVLPVLTRIGCNGGSCHGAAAGKGGLKLSLRGFDPDSDYYVLTHQANGRRVVPGNPAQSLLMLKPTMRIPHGGGMRIRQGSREEAAIAGWISAGAPPPSASDRRIEKLDVTPGVASLHPGSVQQMLATAYYSDGTSADVTRLVKFGSVDGSVASVSDSGLVHVLGRGETAITAWYSSKVNYARVISPYPGSPRARCCDSDTRYR